MKKTGFTLIELLIVIAIIGIVAAIAIPNLLTALHKSKLKATIGDMKSLGTAIEAYMTDINMAPGGGGISLIADLNDYLSPFYIKTLPTRDGWGSMLSYESGAVGANQALYSIISYGRDRLSSGIDTSNSDYVITTMDGFNNDLCFSCGVFTYVPKIR